MRASAPRLTACCLVVSAALLMGCGGSADDEARKINTLGVLRDSAPIPSYHVTDEEIAKAPKGTVRGAFLRYWNNLQFGAWAAAANTYEPGLRGHIGEGLLIRALTNQSATYRAGKPKVVSADTRRNRALVRYLRVGTDVTPASMNWTRDAWGQWRIAYNPLLDQALGDVKQLEVQQQIDPLAQRPAADALRAGSRARLLQSEYLARTRGSSARP